MNTLSKLLICHSERSEESLWFISITVNRYSAERRGILRHKCLRMTNSFINIQVVFVKSDCSTPQHKLCRRVSEQNFLEYPLPGTPPCFPSVFH